MKKLIGIRMSVYEEELGADIVEHNIDIENKNDTNIIFASRRASRAFSSSSIASKESIELITISDGVQNSSPHSNSHCQRNKIYKFLDQVLVKLKRSAEIAPSD